MIEQESYEEICLGVCDIARDAGHFIQQQVSLVVHDEIEEKSAHNYVTHVDKAVEERLVSRLRSLLPGAGFIAEEGTDDSKGEIYNWIIDPIDGTTNYIHQVPLYCVSIALQEKDEIVVGVIYEINSEECFYAWKNGGAFLNKKSIRISRNTNFDTSLIATGFPYYDYGRMDAYMEVFREMMKETAGLRRLGSAAADMAYVAAGRFEGFYEYGLHPWDVAAGVILVKEAGGVVTDFKGGNDAIFGKELVCGNQHVHEEMLKIIQKYFL